MFPQWSFRQTSFQFASKFALDFAQTGFRITQTGALGEAEPKILPTLTSTWPWELTNRELTRVKSSLPGTFSCHLIFLNTLEKKTNTNLSQWSVINLVLNNPILELFSPQGTLPLVSMPIWPSPHRSHVSVNRTSRSIPGQVQGKRDIFIFVPASNIKVFSELWQDGPDRQCQPHRTLALHPAISWPHRFRKVN